jgi:anti-sigma factor RsiW
VAKLVGLEIASRENRLRAIEERWKRLRQRATKITDEELEAIPTLRELRKLEEHAATELGQREVGGGRGASGGTILIMVPAVLAGPASVSGISARVIDIVPGRWQDNPQRALPEPNQSDSANTSSHETQ